MRAALIAGVLYAAMAWPALAQSDADAVDRITPVEGNDEAILSTHDAAPKQPTMPSGVAPFQRTQSPSEFTPPAPLQQATTSANSGGKPAQYQPKVPFGRGEATAIEQQVPKGPPATVAVPVVTVDELEAAEPAPPTPIEPESDPVAENPEEPTELTSPIFEPDANPLAPRRIILRALNKVTAQSAKLAIKPGEKIRFGQIEIAAVTCQQSSPKSQVDHAALLDITERLSDGSIKPLLKGWMYASSPSLTALEHPVYDVTLVECELMPAAPQKAEEPKEKPGNQGKKPKR